MTLARLAAHPRVSVCEHEIHCSAFGTSVCGETEDGETQAERTSSFLEVLDGIAGRGPTSLAHGVKTALTDANSASRLVGCLATHAPGVAVVAVHRRDLVAQLGSLIRAQSLGAWHLARGDTGAGESLAVQIEDERLVRYVKDCVSVRRLLHSMTDRPVLHLEYEEDVATSRDWPKVTAFLGINDGTPCVDRLQKASPDPSNFIVDYPRLSRLAAEVECRSLAAPPPRPSFVSEESRVFLMHRATFASRRGDTADAVADALRAMFAPPNWGVESHQWAAELLQELLVRDGSCDLSRGVFDRLGLVPDPDRHVDALRQAIASTLAD